MQVTLTGQGGETCGHVALLLGAEPCNPTPHDSGRHSILASSEIDYFALHQIYSRRGSQTGSSQLGSSNQHSYHAPCPMPHASCKASKPIQKKKKKKKLNIIIKIKNRLMKALAGVHWHARCARYFPRARNRCPQIPRCQSERD